MRGKHKMDDAMNILICSHEKDPSSTFESVKAYFRQRFPAEDFEWKCTGAILSVSLPAGEKDVISAFEELVKIYPELEVEASCSYDVREDDRSAQWWGTTRIYSKRENGETKIVSSSSTYWN